MLDARRSRWLEVGEMMRVDLGGDEAMLLEVKRRRGRWLLMGGGRE